MAGGGASDTVPMTGVWWDLNTCPVPGDFDPRCVRQCIESALHKQIGSPTRAIIYALGNLEYISSDLLEKISSSGITLIHAPCGGNNLIRLLYQWSRDEKHKPRLPGSGYIMLISCDGTMVDLCFATQRFSKFSRLWAFPKDEPVTTFETVFVKEFVWETLLSDNASPYMVAEVEPFCICQVCGDTFDTCKDFITHLKSEEHREELFGIVPLDCDADYDKPRYFCSVCNYPAYDEFNLSLHNESEDHHHKVADKETRSNLLNEPKDE